MSTSTETPPVLIIGAGPSGLAAALTLVQNGIPIRIIDKLQEFHASSRGSGIHPRTIEIFRFLGIAEDARRLGGPPPPMQLYKLPGGTEPVAKWMLFPELPITPDRPEGTLGLSQYRTEEIFRDHLARRGVHVELSTEPVSLEQDDTGVTVTLKHTGTEQVETSRFAYVIGADGARSFTRKAIGATFEGETKYADGTVFADCQVEGLSDDVWHVWNEPGRFMIALRPKKDPGEYHAMIGCQDLDPADLVDTAKFKEFFYEHTERKDVVFKSFGAITYWKPKMRMVNKLHEGRVFICGDAAHVHSPTGGQGLNTSVSDSFNLAWKVALVYKGLASRDLLITYDAERLPVIAHMLAMTSNLYTHLVNKKKYETAKAEASAASTKETSGFVRWRETGLHQLDINYRWSPIVVDSRGNGGLDQDDLKAHAYTGYPGEPVHAGDRAPEAPALVDATGKETSLFEIFKPYAHTLLLFTPEGAGSKANEVVAAAQASPLAGVMNILVLGREGLPAAIEGANAYHDKEGHAHKAYGIEGQALTVVAVRPDGYIGAIVHDADGLRAYVSKITAGFL